MEFIREKIKDKPINKKRLFMKVITAALCGLVFALIVCIVLMIAIPIIRVQMAGTLVSGSEDSQMGSEDSQTGTEDSSTEGSTEGQHVFIPPNLDLSITDYQAIQDALYRIGNDVNRSIVSVSSVEDEKDWMNSAFETEGGIAGLVISEDSNYFYVLTEREAISEAPLIRVTFVNGASAKAKILKSDYNTGITVLTVEKRLLDYKTRTAIKIATLGDSAQVANGAVVIALGSPLGTNYSILTGNVTSIQNTVSTKDHNYPVFTTDIVAGKTGSGVLVDTTGRVVAMVNQDFSGAQDVNALTAIKINEIKIIINQLANGKDVPYIGVYVSTVTETISEEYSLPKGVYVKEVVTDSPAMNAGLQSGDVIVAINGEIIETDASYSEKIGQLIPGTTCEITVKRLNGNAYYKVTCDVEVGIFTE